ncbi:MAG TPA: hypothetical protein VEM40_06865 [Nitrospirota bacterium]|nr:hypothetical protein [Nitrospirota bacterium]
MLVFCLVLVIIALCATLIMAVNARGKRRSAVVGLDHDRLINPDYIQNAKELPEKSVITAILRDKSIPAASESLIIWGLINFIVWFITYAKVIELLRRIDALSEASIFFLYVGCAIALGMLTFGALGYVTKSVLAGYLNGIMLVAAGLWNIECNMAVANIIRLAGYELTEKGINIWKILGLIQCIWGLLKICGFWKLGLQPGQIDKEIKTSALAKLQEMTRSPEQPNAGRFKISIPNSLLRSILPGMRHGGAYTVWLLPDKACCLHDNLIDYYEYNRRIIAVPQFHNSVEHLMGGDIKIRIDSGLIPLKANSIVMNESAFKSFNEWLGIES